MTDSIGVAVIGAGMAGRSHAHAYRTAQTVFGTVAACGFSYRRSSAVSAIGEHIKTGALGEIQHFNGRYWCDYSADPDAPTSWRYEGPLGSGALADLGSHLVDMSEQLCDPIVKIDGATLPILIKDRPVPLGAALGHAAGGSLSDERRPVTNEDIATFVAEFANGAAGTFSISRRARSSETVSGSRSSAPRPRPASTFLQTPSSATSTTDRIASPTAGGG
jgi:predicted dehydrogenase